MGHNSTRQAGVVLQRMAFLAVRRKSDRQHDRPVRRRLMTIFAAQLYLTFGAFKIRFQVNLVVQLDGRRIGLARAAIAHARSGPRRLVFHRHGKLRMIERKICHALLKARWPTALRSQTRVALQA